MHGMYKEDLYPRNPVNPGQTSEFFIGPVKEEYDKSDMDAAGAKARREAHRERFHGEKQTGPKENIGAKR